MTPTLGGSINTTFFDTEYDVTVQAALATGAYVIVDLHNYARWNGGIIGQGGPTNEEYASIWTQLTSYYGTNTKVIVCAQIMLCGNTNSTYIYSCSSV
jgi:endoglucanase